MITENSVVKIQNLVVNHESRPVFFFFFKNLFYQKNCTEAMNIGVDQIKGAFLTI